MENQFRFYNTLTRKVETVIPHEDGKIAMYTCGPTVYHFAHIGNLRTYIMEDILVLIVDAVVELIHTHKDILTQCTGDMDTVMDMDMDMDQELLLF